MIDDASATTSTHLPTERYADVVASSSPDRHFDVERSSDDVYMLYTGGTTGMPKGVMWRHEDFFFGA